MNKRESNFQALNRTQYNDIIPEYLYYKSVSTFYSNVDFSEYKEVLPNGDEVITIDNFHRCMLEQDEEYKNYVIEDVLYDIDRYGYYAEDYVEDAIGTVLGLLTSDFTPDTLGKEEWDALCFIGEKHDAKSKDRYKKSRHSRKHD